jgi:hypothetical protein
MSVIPFGEWKPDVSDYNGEHTQRAENVFPRGDGYGPVPGLAEYTQALPGTCRGAFVALKSDGTIQVFAGTTTKLYVMSNTDLSWSDVSRSSGGNYALAGTDQWQFAQLADVVLATNKSDSLQSFTMGSSSVFAACAGSPPQAAYITVINQFVVLSGLQANPERIQWSGRSDSTIWDSVTSESNQQDFTDGGVLRGVAGGELQGFVFQDNAIRDMVYQPGTSIIFSFTRIAEGKGLRNPYSLVKAADRIFFRSAAGFEMIIPGSAPVPIGKERFDRTFTADLDSGNLQLFIGAYEPSSSRVYWAYKSNTGAAGLFNRILVWDFALERATLITGVSGEYLTNIAQPGVTLEGMDAFAPGELAITGAASNGGPNLIRIAVASTSTLTTGQVIAISGVVGTTEANGNWTITVFDSGHFDLQGSTFVHAYVSGGIVGGSIDALSVSFDSIQAAFGIQLSIFSSNHKGGFLSGSNLEATVDTAEFGDGNQRIFVRGARPDTDCTTVAGTLLTRNRLVDAAVASVEASLNAIGYHEYRTDARLVKYRERHPASTIWNFSIGVEADTVATGMK